MAGLRAVADSPARAGDHVAAEAALEGGAEAAASSGRAVRPLPSYLFFPADFCVKGGKSAGGQSKTSKSYNQKVLTLFL